MDKYSHHRASAFIGVILISLNLRASITAVGPVLSDVAAELSLSAPELGLLGAIPVVMFAVSSAVFRLWLRYHRLEFIVFATMLLLAIATVYRSWPGLPANLWSGTILIGLTIGIGNIATPALVSKHFVRGIGAVTSVYVAVFGVVSGVAAGISVPLAHRSFLGWRVSLGVWAILSALAALYWGKMALRSRSHHYRSLHQGFLRLLLNTFRLPITRWLSLYMGLQSSLFYVGINWLPIVEQNLGALSATTGLHMLLFLLFGVVANLLTPVFRRYCQNYRILIGLPGVFTILAAAAIFFQLQYAWLWSAVYGFATGISIVLSLAFISTASEDPQEVANISAVVQGVGYTLTAATIVVAGYSYTLSPVAPLCLIVVIALVLTSLAFTKTVKILS